MLKFQIKFHFTRLVDGHLLKGVGAYSKGHLIDIPVSRLSTYLRGRLFDIPVCRVGADSRGRLIEALWYLHQ